MLWKTRTRKTKLDVWQNCWTINEISGLASDNSAELSIIVNSCAGDGSNLAFFQVELWEQCSILTWEENSFVVEVAEAFESAAAGQSEGAII